jgi:hypothetical protein
LGTLYCGLFIFFRYVAFETHEQALRAIQAYANDERLVVKFASAKYQRKGESSAKSQQDLSEADLHVNAASFIADILHRNEPETKYLDISSLSTEQRFYLNECIDEFESNLKQLMTS